jgi:glutamyl-tRNA synthetase
MFAKILDDRGITAKQEYVSTVCGLVKDRINFVSDIWEQASFFFEAPQIYSEAAIKKHWKANTPEIMREVMNILSELTDFTAQNIHDTLHRFSEEKGIGMGQVMTPLRIVLVGGVFGPDLHVIAEMLGKDEVLKRIDSISEQN